MNIKNRAIYNELKKLDEKLEKIEDASTKRVLRGFKRDLVDIRDILDKLYREYEVDGVFNYKRFQKLKDNTILDKYVAAKIINRYVNIEKETNATLNRITKTTFDTMKNIKEIPGIKKEFDVAKIINDKMAGLNWTERYGVKRSEAINNIQKVIKEGLEDGDTYTTMSKKLGEKMSGEAYQIERIVRTESHRCMNDAKLQTFKEINKEYPIKKRWVTAGDERVRGLNPKDNMDHVSMDGVTIPVDEDFELPDGSKGPGPGLIHSGDTYNNINCRCFLIIEME